jgi:murein DD-endopeptidase MepM/ murein hydrolase activator NlpD
MHNFRLPSYIFIIILILFLGIIISTVFLFTYNTRQIIVGMNIDKSEQEHNMLLKKADSLDFLLNTAHNDFIYYITQDNRERTFWQLAYVHPDIWSMGIGGKGYESSNEFLSQKTKNILNKLYESIDVLKGKYYLRKTSINDIQKQIERKKYLWAHIPSTHPLPGRPLGSGFGYRVDPIDKKTIRMHYGVDIGASRGTHILASADGVVSFTGWNTGYGLTVDIDHGFGFRSRYAHCNSILVKKGDFVKRGQIIAKVGSTGRAIAPHLHYEVHVSGVKLNPKPYIDLSSVVFD